MSKKKLSSVLVQALAGEAQAARGFRERPRENKSDFAGASWRGAQTACGLQGGLWRLKTWSEMLEKLWG